MSLSTINSTLGNFSAENRRIQKMAAPWRNKTAGAVYSKSLSSYILLKQRLNVERKLCELTELWIFCGTCCIFFSHTETQLLRNTWAAADLPCIVTNVLAYFSILCSCLSCCKCMALSLSTLNQEMDIFPDWKAKCTAKYFVTLCITQVKHEVQDAIQWGREVWQYSAVCLFITTMHSLPQLFSKNIDFAQ